jgi:hypothetical protein
MVWKEGANDCWSQELIHGVHAIGSGGAGGGVKIGSTYCRGATSEWCRSRSRGRGATRCSCHGRERWWWWCRFRSHHGRHHRGFHGCCAAIVGSAVVTSGHRLPLDVVVQHTKGSRSSPEKRRSSLGRRHSRGRVGRVRQTPRV